MEKLSFVLSGFPDIIKKEDDRYKQGKARIEQAEGLPPGKGWNLLVARDRLFGIFKETAEGNEENSRKESLHTLKQKSEVMLDLGNLEYNTGRKEDSLRSWAHYKIGLAKTLHNYDILYIKFYRDVMKSVFAMNKASNLAYSSPKQLMDSVQGVMASMKSFVGMLQPMARVMGRMNEVNLKIVKLGHEMGPEGANKVFSELQEKIMSYPDLPQKIASIGSGSERPSDELKVGKFYQDWTGDCLRQGLETLRYASGCMKKHCNKLKTLASMSKAARQIKMSSKGDYKTFSLPPTFAQGEEDGGEVNQKTLQEVEMGMSQFAGFNNLETEIPDIMDNDLLKDPYLLSAETLAQGSLGKDITGLDDSLQISSQVQSSFF